MRRRTGTAIGFAALVLAFAPAVPAFAGYGAIAWDKESGKSGWIWDQPTPKKAEEMALSKCGASSCKVIVHTNAGRCAALATIATGKFVGASARKTQDEARLAALSDCQKGKAGDCVVRASGCNK
ncbi:MAG: DUF4189 domain-containing protein [Stellaceae bacterium]